MWKENDVTPSLSCPSFLYWFMFFVTTKYWPRTHFLLFTHKHALRATVRACVHGARGQTIRERWSAFSNVSSKCQLKITRVLEKVGSEGTDIFFFFFDTTMFIWPGWWLTWRDLLCQLLNTLGQGRPSEYQWKAPVGKYVRLRLTLTVQSAH